MSEKVNRPGGDQGNSGRSQDENTNHRKNYDGFEGMNYEQVRQPYPFDNDTNRNNHDSKGKGRGMNE